MNAFFGTLGVISGVLLLSLIIYLLFFKKKDSGSSGGKSGRFFVSEDDTKERKDDSDVRTLVPPLLYFILASTGQKYEVTRIPEEGVTVGRVRPSDIVVTSPKGNYLSSQHFVIGQDDDGMFLTVTEKAHENGNGIRLEPDLSSTKIRKSIPITHGLKVYIGNDALTFYLPGMNCEDAVTPVSTNRVVRRT